MVFNKVAVPLAVGCAWIILPQFVFFVALANLSICVGLSGAHLWSTLQVLFDPRQTLPAFDPHPVSGGDAVADRPSVSIHVPVYNEPPAVVTQTLLSLARLDYLGVEVLVLDNNTPEAATYLPVQRLCAQLGPRFRFFHFDGVTGAKAGALNLCLQLMDPDAQLVAIVDADYQVEPHFLRSAAAHLQSSAIGFVQFPQAYRGADRHGREVACELNDYFSAFAKRANTTRSMLLTGTLSVIRADVLRKAGGWTSRTITEDAELGARLFLDGINGVFVDEKVGTGLLPVSIQGLHVQRARWVAGNVQTLAGLLASCPSAPMRQGFSSLLSQLTAWPTFWLVPALVLGCAIASPPAGPWRERAVDVAAVSIPLSLALLGLRLLASARLRGDPAASVLTSLAVKLALMWTSSTAWIDGLAQKSMPFARTPKGRTAGDARPFEATWAIALAGLAGALVFAAAGSYGAVPACLLIFATAPASFWTSRALENYASALETQQEHIQ